MGTNTSAFPLSSLAWGTYTTIVLPSGPTLSPAGEARCEPDAFHATMLAAARAHNRSLTWGGGVDVYALISNASFAPYRAAYLRTIGGAAAACGVTGIEFDYECPPTPAGRAGIVSAGEADAYTTFLVDVLAALPPGGTVSADVGVWGLDGAWGKGDSYPLALSPWVNATKVAAHPNIFVNSMSYHTPDSCSILPWQLDGLILSEVWGIPKAQINIGVGFYGWGPNGTEPMWGALSKACPSVAPSDCHCGGVAFTSKAQCFAIGAWAKARGFRGVFPWAANYDAIGEDSLIAWVGAGAAGGSG